MLKTCKPKLGEHCRTHCPPDELLVLVTAVKKPSEKDGQWSWGCHKLLNSLHKAHPLLWRLTSRDNLAFPRLRGRWLLFTSFPSLENSSVSLGQDFTLGLLALHWPGPYPWHLYWLHSTSQSCVPPWFGVRWAFDFPGLSSATREGSLCPNCPHPRPLALVPRVTWSMSWNAILPSLWV